MNRIRECRKKKKLTLKQLSEELAKNNFKISADALGKYERGDREPKMGTWVKLADFFRVPVTYLQGISGDSLSFTDDWPLRMKADHLEKFNKFIDQINEGIDSHYEEYYSSKEFDDKTKDSVGSFLENAESLSQTLLAFNKLDQEASKSRNLLFSYLNDFLTSVNNKTWESINRNDDISTRNSKLRKSWLQISVIVATMLNVSKDKSFRKAMDNKVKQLMNQENSDNQ